MKKIIKIIKWYLIINIVSIFILGIVIYISSLSSYKESDFNIPKNFFKTKFENKQGKNGFHEFVNFNDKLGKDFEKTVNIKNIELKSRCLFGERKGKICEAMRENDKELTKFKIYLKLNNLRLNKIITENDFFRPTKEYDGLKGKNIIYTPLLQYFRSSRYIIYKYFEEGKQNEGINLLLQNQENLDELINKSDLDLIGNIFLVNLEKQNLNLIKYLLEKYKVNGENKEKIKKILEKNLYNKLTENGIKWEHKIEEKKFSYLGIKDFSILKYLKFRIKNGFGVIEIFQLPAEPLLFSVKETTLLDKKIKHDIIKNKGISNFFSKVNINNYLGRNIINLTIPHNFKYIFEKEEKMQKLREKILSDLNIQ